MPILEFECEKCHETFQELIRNASDSATPICAHCGAKQVRRLFSTFSASTGAGPKGSSKGGSKPLPWSGKSGGGGCGPGCGCH